MIWGRDHRLALTFQVRPRPAHDLSRGQPKARRAADCTSDRGGFRGYRAGPATRSSILTVHILAGAHGLVAASGLARAFSIFLVMSHTRSFGLE